MADSPQIAAGACVSAGEMQRTTSIGVSVQPLLGLDSGAAVRQRMDMLFEGVNSLDSFG